MSRTAETTEAGAVTEPVRVLGRGVAVRRGVHLTLRTVREAVGKTQAEIARKSGIDQGDVSRLEARPDLDDCHLATLRRYVEALGGQLELVAKFDDKSIILVGATTTTPA